MMLSDTRGVRDEPAVTARDRTRNIERERREFMASNPDLYAYIEARVEARTYKDAGDHASGALDQYGASNRCYALGGRAEERLTALRERLDYSTDDRQDTVQP